MILKFFLDGGPIMFPLLLCSVAALIIILERIFFYLICSKCEKREIRTLRTALSRGNFEEIRNPSANWESSLAKVVAVMLRNFGDVEMMDAAAEAAGNEEVKRMERGLNVLDTIVTAAPLLGLLGTVTGIIKTFNALSVVGGNQAAHLSAGISEALYTTAFGLGIAIPAMFCLNFFYATVEKRAMRLNSQAQEIMTILKKRTGER